MNIKKFLLPIDDTIEVHFLLGINILGSSFWMAFFGLNFIFKSWIGALALVVSHCTRLVHYMYIVFCMWALIKWAGTSAKHTAQTKGKAWWPVQCVWLWLMLSLWALSLYFFTSLQASGFIYSPKLHACCTHTHTHTHTNFQIQILLFDFSSWIMILMMLFSIQ